MENQIQRYRSKNGLQLHGLECMAQKNLQALRAIESGLTVEKALENGTMIDKVVIEHGEELVENTICGLILMTSGFFNVAHNISDDQALMIAGDILERYRYENIEDIILACKSIRMNEVKLMHKLDAETIHNAICAVIDKKIDARDARHQKQKEEYAQGYQRTSSKNTVRELHREALKNYLQKPQP